MAVVPKSSTFASTYAIPRSTLRTPYCEGEKIRTNIRANNAVKKIFR